MRTQKNSTRKKAAAYKHVDRVEVFLWGQLMGAVVLDPAYGYYAFAYAPAFLKSGMQPSPLRMALNNGDAYLFTDLPAETYKRLPALLSDALPDDFGNALINRYMADHGISGAEITSLDRLAYMSNRAISAMTFKPARGPAKTQPTSIELSQLVTEARKAVSGTIEDDDHANAALRSIIDVGTSAGGARAKALSPGIRKHRKSVQGSSRHPRASRTGSSSSMAWARTTSLVSLAATAVSSTRTT